jgi:hypothetical protein
VFASCAGRALEGLAQIVEHGVLACFMILRQVMAIEERALVGHHQATAIASTMQFDNAATGGINVNAYA